MMQEPTAFSLLRAGLAPILDAVGVALLVWLGFQVMFGGSQPFETYAVCLGIIGALACWIAPGAVRNLPIPMLAYVSIALLSAAASRWGAVTTAPTPDWWALFTPATHLLTMVVYIFGAAFLLRTPWRLSLCVVLLAGSIIVLGTQLLFDRVSTNFVFIRNGSVSLPSVAQWGGLHQMGMLLVLALPFPASLLLLGRSPMRVAAGLTLVIALMTVAVINSSTGGIVAMTFVALTMAGCVAAKNIRRKSLRVLLAGAVLATFSGSFIAVATGRVPLVAHGDLAGRVPIWRAAAAICRDHVWLGVGPGRYSTMMLDGGYAARFLPPGGGAEQAHNLLLHQGAEIGAIGMLCVAALWLWLLRACWRAWLDGRLPLVTFGLSFALAGFFIRSMSDNFLDNLVTTDRTRVLIWMLFAAALAVERLPRFEATAQ